MDSSSGFFDVTFGDAALGRSVEIRKAHLGSAHHVTIHGLAIMITDCTDCEQISYFPVFGTQTLIA